MIKSRKKYLLGVDGGNSKTDYLLCSTSGDFIDIFRTDTCSHEQFVDGFDGMEAAMRNQLNGLFSRNNISVNDIEVAVFGLAGADLNNQIAELTNKIKGMGFSKFVVANDGILGVKAISQNGFGVCGICGTGTVVIGIDEKNEILQVGGTGSITGDYSGGGYIMRQGILACYSHFFKIAPYSTMIPKFLEVLGVSDLSNLQSTIYDNNLLHKNMTKIIQIIDQEATNGDRIAKNILDMAGINVGEGVSGCIRNLHFKSEITIVLGGSLWSKIVYNGLVRSFKDTILNNTKINCKFIVLNSPPSIGAIFWAKEMFDEKPIDIDYRNKMLTFLTNEAYEKYIKAEMIK